MIAKSSSDLPAGTSSSDNNATTSEKNNVVIPPNNNKLLSSNIDKMINERNDRMVQLYCMSRLSDLLKINDRKEIHEQIDQFVSENNIRKGKKFQRHTLPRSSYLLQRKSISPENIVNKNNKSSRTPTPSPRAISPSALTKGNITGTNQKRQNKTLNNNNNKVGGSKSLTDLSYSKIDTHTDNNIPRTSSITIANHYVSSNNSTLKRPLQDELASTSKDEHLPPEKKLKSNLSTPISNNSNNNISSTPLTRPTPVKQELYYPGVNILPSIPTPVNSDNEFEIIPLLNDLMKLRKKQEKDKIMNDINHQRQQEKQKSLSDISSRNQVYLLMNETIPSKIPQALPLAELKYMAQTLPLINLIPRAHKALTTDIINDALNESRITVVGSRIEELRRLGLWSLRQPKKFIDSAMFNNQHTHHSTLLNEAKWMSTDFKESLNFKIAMSMVVAKAVQDYWKFGKIVCIKVKEPNYLMSININPDTVTTTVPTINDNDANLNNGNNSFVDDVSTASSNEKANDNTDDKTSNKEDITIERKAEDEKYIDISKLLERPDPSKEIVPVELPSISLEEYEQHLQDEFNKDSMKLILNSNNDPILSPLEKTLLKELPKYIGISDHELTSSQDSLPFTPISKALVTLDDEHFYKLIEKQVIDEEQSIAQLSKRRGMFYGNRRSHYLRPPPVPSLRYLQNRTPTIWLPEDDQELVRNINSYGYNWELISSHMISDRPSQSFMSNMERRTPWQCFERFVQLNEKLNFNDLKGPRAHAAQQWLMEAHKFQQAQNRRISPLGVGPDSIQRGHKRLRWASMFDSMKKIIKKRENAPKPNATQPRKPLDCKNMKVPTPAEMSELKAQRDDALRRDIQLRRTAKNRIQQKQIQAAAAAAQIASSPGALPTSSQNQKSNRSSTSTGRARSSTPKQVQSSSSLPNNVFNNNNNNIDVNGTNAVKRSLNHITQSNSNLSLSLPSPPKQPTASNAGPTPSSSGRVYTAREVIETYMRKIMAQKPDISPKMAMKAAENYYNTLKEQKQLQQQHQLQQQLQSQSPTPSHAVTTLSSAPHPQQQFPNGNGSNLGSMPNVNNVSSKIKSPTPQEILERSQQQKQEPSQSQPQPPSQPQSQSQIETLQGP
ncbi:Eaf1p NDAI_0B05550 [Naumovozyma dairenensis CBS 421]|uniref:Chromatin modification-related protein EAF1 n=1 Tax=Naumovozyma dairenensis (strain ATCC 10597 / BCRC 20456 / CBS 421 / NBRC 0211 / NRRL Y-12639) TaxID=1071378 RepID=G0W727_NAUDC|nr:hypothetical protein NDAI_0B05550 [Naumovozyma dairenensis CBS 421]CCD23588.1 hypothetical protein NDAI_0B05550 [Naumovozyma dairenensis CBS 421]